MCLIHTEDLITHVFLPERNGHITFCWKFVLLHCKTPSGHDQETVCTRLRYTVAPEGQADGLHLRSELYGTIQAYQRNVIDHTEVGACVGAMAYYLLNAELLVVRTVASAVIAYFPFLIVVSQSHTSSVDTTIQLCNELTGLYRNLLTILQLW